MIRRAVTPRMVPVAAGVLTDASGRVLLARRISGRDLAGAWEFPGGKIERNETPEQALKRELKEELGIDVQLGCLVAETRIIDAAVLTDLIEELFCRRTDTPQRS